MGNTWIIDMSHFDYSDDEADNIPASALKFWRYFGAIIAATVGKPPSRLSTGLSCRRRPGRVPCDGVIESELQPSGNGLRWWCPICADNGRISHWEGTRWAPSGKPLLISTPISGQLFGSEHGSDLRVLAPDQIEGTIEWDEENDGELPRIVTAHRMYSWSELGRELMTYEGFRISIRLGS